MKLLIDVRTLEEFEEHHAEGALNVPIEDIEAGKLGILEFTPKGAPLELYCHTGNRAEKAKEFLSHMGFTSIENLGGIDDIGKSS